MTTIVARNNVVFEFRTPRVRPGHVIIRAAGSDGSDSIALSSTGEATIPLVTARALQAERAQFESASVRSLSSEYVDVAERMGATAVEVKPKGRSVDPDTGTDTREITYLEMYNVSSTKYYIWVSRLGQVRIATSKPATRDDGESHGQPLNDPLHPFEEDAIRVWPLPPLVRLRRW